VSTFSVDGVDYELVDDPTWPEAIQIQKLTGAAPGTPGQEVAQTAAGLFISMKRKDPTLTWDAFGKISLSRFGLDGLAQDAEAAEAPKEETSDGSDAST